MKKYIIKEGGRHDIIILGEKFNIIWTTDLKWNLNILEETFCFAFRKVSINISALNFNLDKCYCSINPLYVGLASHMKVICELFNYSVIF